MRSDNIMRPLSHTQREREGGHHSLRERRGPGGRSSGQLCYDTANILKINQILIMSSLSEVHAMLKIEIDRLDFVAEEFKKFTSESIQFIGKSIIDAEIEFYVHQWFQSYLNYKDECLFIQTGKADRIYHRRMLRDRKQLIHERSEQRKNFNRDGKIDHKLILSKCSYEGLIYEYEKGKKEKVFQKLNISTILFENSIDSLIRISSSF